MGGLQEIGASRLRIMLPAGDLLSKRSQTFTHPGEVVNDQELSLSDKRSLLASWASDAHAVENSPWLRQLSSGAVVRVDDILAALKSLDPHEPRCKAAFTFVRSFPRRSKLTARRRIVRSEDDDEPPPSAASARIPPAPKISTGVPPASTSRHFDVTIEPRASATCHFREISVGGRSAA
jgi:hypothetical protein